MIWKQNVQIPQVHTKYLVSLLNSKELEIHTLAWLISHENERFDDIFFIFVIFFHIGTFFSNLLHTFELK